MSLRNLVKSFNDMDVNKDGKLDPDDFKWGLRNNGLNFSP
jgi:Ca2+-binding EF-hand superfamily protein